MRFSTLLLLISTLIVSSISIAAPDLPDGLNTPSITTPLLPDGLFKPPSLPERIDTSKQPESPLNTSTLNISGFADYRVGIRTQQDPNENQQSLHEMRFQLALQKETTSSVINITADFLADGISSQHAIDLESGQGWIDLREANIVISPLSYIDVKIGRQVLTWGTGDLIFINDLFPKDWQAFFIGRDLEYLKAPSDAIKASFFSAPINVDIIYTPQFDADRSISGDKLSYFSPLSNSLVGDRNIIKPNKPHADEFALRFYKNIGTNELALYAYHGFWKSPVGFDPLNNTNRYPALRSIGASLRTPLWQGIGNIELGYYDSYEHTASDNPFTPNSEARLLIGYEQELIRNLTVSMQYYAEWMQDYDRYKTSMELIGAVHKKDEIRQVFTNRIRLQTHQQNVAWSIFTFYSPTDGDGYVRPNIHYKYNDNWSLEAGGNVFIGQEANTFFAQFKKNNNLYASIRYGF